MGKPEPLVLDEIDLAPLLNAAERLERAYGAAGSRRPFDKYDSVKIHDILLSRRSLSQSLAGFRCESGWWCRDAQLELPDALGMLCEVVDNNPLRVEAPELLDQALNILRSVSDEPTTPAEVDTSAPSIIHLEADTPSLDTTSEGWKLDEEQVPADAKTAAAAADSQRVDRAQKFRNLEPAKRKAYLAFELAESMAGRKLEDREAYDKLDEEGLPAAIGDLGELTDYELPSFDTWARQLRSARNALGDQKYSPRAGRPFGGSVVMSDEI